MAKFVSFVDSRDVGQKKDVLEIIILPYIQIHHKPEASVKFILGGSQAKVAEFWRAMKGHPSLASRPELRSRKDLHHVVPISIHGDGVTYAKTMRAGNESMEVATLLSSYLIICLVKSVIKTVFLGNTWQAVWKIILWSLNALSSGLWPSQDWQGRQCPAQSRDAKRAGTQLAGGYAATPWNIRADLEFLALHFGLRHYSSNQPCSLCQAARNEVCLGPPLWAIQTTRVNTLKDWPSKPQRKETSSNFDKSPCLPKHPLLLPTK